MADDPESVANRQRMRDMLRRMHESSLRRIRLKGQVVDDDGRRLPDVTVRVEAFRDDKDVSNPVLHDGRFDFDFPNVAGEFELIFHQKGYLATDVRVSSDPDLTQEQWAALVQGGLFKTPDVRRRSPGRAAEAGEADEARPLQQGPFSSARPKARSPSSASRRRPSPAGT